MLVLRWRQASLGFRVIDVKVDVFCQSSEGFVAREIPSVWEDRWIVSHLREFYLFAVLCVEEL